MKATDLFFAESLIYLTANFYNATLFTLDKYFEGLNNFVYNEKEK
jgi:hypothetical protein